MKKSIYSLGFVVFLQLSSFAQSQDQTKPAESKKQTSVNPDGTLAPEAKTTGNTDNAIKKEETTSQPAQRAITEKGLPTSKGPSNKTKSSTAPKTTEPAKTEKK